MKSQMKCEVRVVKSEYGHEHPAILVTGKAEFARCSKVYYLASVVYGLAEQGTVDLALWAVNVDLNNYRIELEPCDGAVTAEGVGILALVLLNAAQA